VSALVQREARPGPRSCRSLLFSIPNRVDNVIPIQQRSGIVVLVACHAVAAFDDFTATLMEGLSFGKTINARFGLGGEYQPSGLFHGPKLLNVELVRLAADFNTAAENCNPHKSETAHRKSHD
jgi:hypothetical protein